VHGSGDIRKYSALAQGEPVACWRGPVILIKIPICQKVEPEIHINEHGCEPE
jgi:hypothetical protein